MISALGECKMPNFLQKWLYNLSAGAPLLLVFAIVWYCEKRIWIVSAVCVGLATLLMVLMLVAFSYGKRNLPNNNNSHGCVTK